MGNAVSINNVTSVDGDRSVLCKSDSDQSSGSHLRLAF